MSKKFIILCYIIAAIILVAIVVYYRKYILSDSLNDKIDIMFDTNYTPAYLQNANGMFKGAILNQSFVLTAKQFTSIIQSNYNTYQDIANKVNSNIPFYFIGVIHARESDCNFNTHLYNGDSLQRRTVNEPKGLPKANPENGSVYTFVESAVDTLFNKGFNKWNDWSIGGMIYLLERYNGFGYARKNKVSPYLWSGSQYYTSGKFVADHVYSDSAVDKQIGAATLMKYFIEHNS